MGDLGMNKVKNPSVSKIAQLFNDIPIDSIVQGIKIAYMSEIQIIKEEILIKEHKEKENIEVIPTGTEIRHALEEGEYRAIREEKKEIEYVK